MRLLPPAGEEAEPLEEGLAGPDERGARAPARALAANYHNYGE